MKQNWKQRVTSSCGINSINKLVAKKGSSIMNKLFESRQNLALNIVASNNVGIGSIEHIDVYDPIAKTVGEHIKANKPILIYGDSDADGITATVSLETLLLVAVKDLGSTSTVQTITPDRVHRGYGIKVEDIVAASTSPASDWLVISVDCGTNDVKPVKQLKELGYNVIITDHHLSEGEITKDVTVLNPKLFLRESDHEYHASGCYVAAKLGMRVVRLFSDKINEGESYWARAALYYVDALVAVSLISDYIPLNPTMRTQYLRGVIVMQSGGMVGGLAILLAKSWYATGTPVTSTLLAFNVIPRINSAGRMGRPELAVRALSIANLLSSINDPEMSLKFYREKSVEIDELITTNQARKELESELECKVYDAIAEDKKKDPESIKHAIVVHVPDVEIGTVGVVAAKITADYNVPTLILTNHNGNIHGSGRSPNAYDLHGLLKSCNELLLGCGGHRNAAGLSLKPENLEAFKAMFIQKTKEHPAVDSVVEYDGEVEIQDFYDARIPMLLKYVEPIGNGNSAPTFLIKNVKVISSFMKGEVLNLLVLDEKHNHTLMLTRYRPTFNVANFEHRKIDVLIELTVNYFGGLTAPEYRIADVYVYPDEKLDAEDAYTESMMNKL